MLNPSARLQALTTHTPLIKGVEAHPLNSGGGLSQTSSFIVFSEPHPLN